MLTKSRKNAFKPQKAREEVRGISVTAEIFDYALGDVEIIGINSGFVLLELRFRSGFPDNLK